MSLIAAAAAPPSETPNSHPSTTTIPPIDQLLDLISIYLILSLFLFSIFSLLLILYLRIRSFPRRSRLRSFAVHSSQRLLLVSLISLWSLTELLRIPFYRLHSLPTFLQIHLCNLHLILSLGFLQPAFLLSLVLLLNSSLHPRSSPNFHLQFHLSLCLPISFSFYLITYKLRFLLPLPDVFFQTSILFDDPRHRGCKVVLCTFPLLSAVVFAVFSVAYSVSLLLKSWQVVSMAINKRLAARINVLSFTVLVSLAVQVVLMSITVFFSQIGALYYFLVFLIFASVLVCAVVGEGVLVIIPILDALSTTIVARKDVQDDDEEELNE